MTIQPNIIEDPVDGSTPSEANLWYGLAEDAKQNGLYSLDRLMHALQEDYAHSYGSTVHAVAACMLAAGHLMAARLNLDDQQEACVIWEVLKRWNDWPDGPMRLIRYERMLWLGNERYFARDITQDVWNWVRNRARKLIQEYPNADPEQMRFWEEIAVGRIPYQLQLKQDV